MFDFIKMHGLSNDFVIFDARGGKPSPAREKMAEIADRRTGVGCDQIIILQPANKPSANAFMRIYNADGSEAEACGNATRCVASLLMKELDCDAVTIETVAGMLECSACGGDRERVTVDMGAPKFGGREIPLSEERDSLHLGLEFPECRDPVAVNMGNPHCVFFVESVESFPVHDIGPQVETHSLFPQKTNVEFAQIVNRDQIRMRVWERGVGITAACGSGACATVAAALSRDLCSRHCDVILDGGTLSFVSRESDGHLFMTGPAAFVFRGHY